MIDKKTAIQLSESKFWERMSFKERAQFQINQELLCMPFDVFHEAVEKTVGHPVFTHEFAVRFEELKNEIMRYSDGLFCMEI